MAMFNGGIDVSGEASKRYKQDRVRIIVNVCVQKQTREEVMETISVFTEAFNKVLEDNGIDKSSAKTIEYDVKERYDRKVLTETKGIIDKSKVQTTKYEKVGAVGRQTLDIEMAADDPAKTAKIVAELSAIAEVETTVYPVFAMSDEMEEKIHVEMLSSAVKNARRDAETIMEAAGGKLGSLIAITTEEEYSQVLRNTVAPKYKENTVTDRSASLGSLRANFLATDTAFARATNDFASAEPEMPIKKTYTVFDMEAPECLYTKTVKTTWKIISEENNQE